MASYRKISDREWDSKTAFFKNNHSPCRLCPRECRAERESDRTGVCRASGKLRIASYNLHFGEEPPVSGTRGSGTVFFSGCTLKCMFCQNYPISQLDNGKEYSIRELSDIFIYLKNRGAHNINLVSPTPYLFHIITALRSASQRGLDIPIVYNSSGYESMRVIRELDSIVDIYMPDFKYSDGEISHKYSGVTNYTENALSSISEMFRQTGPLSLDKDWIALRGVIIRHLILPSNPVNSEKVLEIISRSSFRDSSLSLMSQFFPAYKAAEDPAINRRLKQDEYERIKTVALALGFDNGWFQDI